MSGEVEPLLSSNQNLNILSSWSMEHVINSKKWLAQSAGAVKYTNCISAEGLDSPNECPGYDIKQSDG